MTTPSRSRTRRISPDAWAILALLGLWMLYFWRVLTPNAGDALSLTEGDFSAQFVTFFSYQVERLSAGEIPLWNPYNYAGHPFLADTQSAVFYPPRLLTVALLSLGSAPAPGTLYAALQTEMMVHVLLGTLLMYAFVRRLTTPAGPAAPPALAPIVGGVVAAVTYGYGGYLSGYPQLQLAVLEAGIWLPLALLAILQATRTPRTGWTCLVLAGVAYGLSLLAGHPQTSLFALYLGAAFLAFRQWPQAPDWRARLRRYVPALALIGLIAGGLAAIQLLPGLEYLRHTTRQDMGFDAKSNGFPYADLAQIAYPGFITLWSPLYVGIAGLALAGIALWQRTRTSRFFGIAALVGLGLSFGAGTILYDIAYLIAPGMSWFRGQERAAFVAAFSASVLAGMGASALLGGTLPDRAAPGLRRLLLALSGVSLAVGLVLFVLWRTPDGGTYLPALNSVIFTTLLLVATAALMPRALRLRRAGLHGILLVSLIVFDLFSVTQYAANYDPIPAANRLPEPDFVAALRAELPPGARIDGTQAPTGNYGTLYHLPDIYGISPLELSSIRTYRDDLPPGRAWDLLAVRTVPSTWRELPVPSTITDTIPTGGDPINIHTLDDPRPFAYLTYNAAITASDAAAYGLLREPSFDARQHAILARNPGVDLPGAAPDTPGSAQVTRFEPETITVEGTTPAPAILTLALPDYPGWHASLNGADVSILRAYGGLSAVALPQAGDFTLTLTYDPWTFKAGAALTALTWLAVLAITIGSWRRTRAAGQPVPQSQPSRTPTESRSK